MKKKSGLEIYENNPSAHSIFSAHRVGRGASYKYISSRQFYSLFRRLFVFLSFLGLFFSSRLLSTSHEEIRHPKFLVVSNDTRNLCIGYPPMPSPATDRHLIVIQDIKALLFGRN